ncbi:ferritin-like domain-containing protein [Edaphobacter sp.]|uniref:ferritin-like domain-containing protein n=1 Tax=Edaphobacter sp. TaxID=1934404 RepID=UPI002DBE9F34|nr:ferritin-like domain-containing protein [Edaphobacter sp.]HEU5341443.1 ferritin-like domain-containing protein [Edaphobacter sp.]
MEKIDHLIKRAVSRRSFLAGAGTATAALAIGCSSNSVSTGGGGGTNPGITDNDIMNFALNLEYLEAEFYLYAATGKGLASADAGTGAGTTTVPSGIAAVPWGSSGFAQYASEIAQDEVNHVRFLRQAITGNGGTPVSRPNIDLTFFAPLAVAAGITTTPTFNPFLTPQAFLIGAFVFEDVGVTAYHGAAGLISSSTILGAAAGILGVEAYHAAAIRTLLTESAATTSDQTYVNIANKVADLRGTLGGSNETHVGLYAGDPTVGIVAADTTNAIAFSRSTDQVLHIVYGAVGGAGVGKGGFFPNGLNGKITATAS